MTTLLLEPARGLGGCSCEPDPDAGRELGEVMSGHGAGGPEMREAACAHGRFTLDELITGVWEDLAVRATVRCPVCGGGMAARELPDQSRGGACLDCGSRLS